MRGGAISSAPFGLRLLLIATFLSVAMLLVAYSLLAKQKKPICHVDVYGSRDKAGSKAIDSKLSHLCGPLIKMNTLKDIPFVFLCGGFSIAIITWSLCVVHVIKSSWWDCTLRGNCSSISEIYWYYSIFGALVTLFLVPGFISIARKKERTCQSSPSTNCKSASYNGSSSSLLLFSAIFLAIIAVSLVIVLFFYNSNEA